MSNVNVIKRRKKIIPSELIPPTNAEWTGRMVRFGGIPCLVYRQPRPVGIQRPHDPRPPRSRVEVIREEGVNGKQGKIVYHAENREKLPATRRIVDVDSPEDPNYWEEFILVCNGKGEVRRRWMFEATHEEIARVRTRKLKERFASRLSELIVEDGVEPLEAMNTIQREMSAAKDEIDGQTLAQDIARALPSEDNPQTWDVWVRGEKKISGVDRETANAICRGMSVMPESEQAALLSQGPTDPGNFVVETVEVPSPPEAGTFVEGPKGA